MLWRRISSFGDESPNKKELAEDLSQISHSFPMVIFDAVAGLILVIWVIYLLAKLIYPTLCISLLAS